MEIIFDETWFQPRYTSDFGGSGYGGGDDYGGQERSYGGADAVDEAIAVASGSDPLESWTWAGDGSDLTDLGGSGGDITTKFSGGKLSVTGSPLHGVFTKLLPASGKFDLTIKYIHSAGASTHFIASFNFLNNQNVRRIGAYSASEQNAAITGDQSCCLTLNSGKFSSPPTLSGNLLDLIRQDEGLTLAELYNIITSYAGTTTGDGVQHTIVIHVDASGATPLVSVDFDGSEVVAQQNMLAGDNAYGRYLSLYIEGSGSGTTPLADCTINEVSVQEVA